MRPVLLHGVLVIDKPIGPTSHDVVSRLRKALDMRAIGHAGTLDPAASGVLVVAVGEATKLSAYLTAEAKAYHATVTLGTETTTLDAEGEIVREAPIAEALTAELVALAAARTDAPLFAERTATIAPLLAAAIEAERGRNEQMPPAFSAIKTGGRVAYELARRGEPVVLTPRAVEVKELTITGATANTFDLSMRVSKGYYVRALARDLGERLGVPSHLSALRRVASGSFTLSEALPLGAPRDALESAIVTLASAARRALPAAELTSEGRDRARVGKPLSIEHFVAEPPAEVAAWIGPEGELVAIGQRAPEGHFAVERGFSVR